MSFWKKAGELALKAGKAGLEQAQAASFPISAFAMGAPGGITRFASLYLGGHISYAALHEGDATAPGQLSISRLRALCTLFEETA